MNATRRELLCGTAGAIALSLPGGALAQGQPITPERFGARGDGRTNDTAAFAAMAAFVNARGGGEVLLRPVTYIVGLQLRGSEATSGYAFDGAPIMEFSGCQAPLVIRGNGARLLCAAGLRYGTFDPLTEAPSRHSMPYIRGGELATPYRAMIKAERCSASVEISDLELDGNLSALRIGGKYGDTGWLTAGAAGAPYGERSHSGWPFWRPAGRRRRIAAHFLYRRSGRHRRLQTSVRCDRNPAIFDC